MHHHRIRLVPRQRGEGGETLLELMATVVLMGVSIVALLGSLLGAMTTANVHRRTVRAGNETVNVVESIRSVDYVPCATVSSYAGAMPSPPPNFTYEITELRRLANTTAGTASWVSGGTCSAANDTGVQEITVRVASTAPSTVARTLTFVKRNRFCPGQSAADPEVC